MAHIESKSEIRVSITATDGQGGPRLYVSTNRSLTNQVNENSSDLRFYSADDVDKAVADSNLHKIVAMLFSPECDHLGVTSVVAGRRSMGIYVTRAADRVAIADAVCSVLGERYVVIRVDQDGKLISTKSDSRGE